LLLLAVQHICASLYLHICNCNSAHQSRSQARFRHG